MRLWKLLMASIFIIAILTTSSMAAIRTVTYTSELFTTTTPNLPPPGKYVDWTDNHTLPYFDPAKGTLISVDFEATLNASLVGQAENLADSLVPNAYMAVDTNMSVKMINGKLLPLKVLLRIPKTGFTPVGAWDGATDYAGPDSFSGTDANDTWGTVFYNDAANLSGYIGTGTFNLLTVTEGKSDVMGSGTWQSLIITRAWSYARITYTYNDALCLSGYKKDGCTGLPLSGWNITVRNSSWQRNATTNSSGFWLVCNLTPGSYWVNETAKSGWMNTTPASQSLLLGQLNRTVNFFNIPISNFTISKTAAPERPDPGEIVTFTINVTNIGVASLSSVRVMDVLPVEMTYISSNPPGTLSDNIIVWENVGPIGPFSSTYLQVLMRSAE